MFHHLESEANHIPKSVAEQCRAVEIAQDVTHFILVKKFENHSQSLGPRPEDRYLGHGQHADMDKSLVIELETLQDAFHASKITVRT